MAEQPFISIITPSLDRASMIAGAIESVLSQDYPRFEHIIVDGGSTDGTLELLKQYSHLRVVTGKDRGVYDALNKGIALAHGEIIGQLNSDDHYGPGAFSSIRAIFSEDNNVEAVSAGAQVYESRLDGQPRILATYPGVRPSELLYRATIGVPVFNGWFFKKSLFEKIGGYSLDFSLAADRDFLIRCALQTVPSRCLDTVLYHYRQHSGSLTITDNRGQRVKYIHEALHLASSYLDRPGSESSRAMFADWLAYLCGELLVAGFVLRNTTLIVEAMQRAKSLSPMWFFRFLYFRRKQQIFLRRIQTQ